jgi:hypothetical protein
METEFDTRGLSVNCDACGKYGLTEKVHHDLVAEGKYKDEKFKISGWTRQLSEARRQRFLVTEANLPELLRTAPVPRTPTDVMDRIVLQVYEHLPSIMGATPLHDHDFPLVFARNFEEFNDFVDLVQRMGLIVANRYTNWWDCWLTVPAGWQYASDLRKSTPVSNRAFVAMWFDPQMDDAYTLGIAPALSDAGYTPVRVDREHYNDKIDDKIIAEIRRSGLVVADFTGERGGVYYEAGFARALGLLVVSTVRKDHIARLHFDTRQYNHIVWETPA